MSKETAPKEQLKRLNKAEQEELAIIIRFEKAQANKLNEIQTIQFFASQYKNNWLNQKLKELGLDLKKVYKIGDDGEFIEQKEEPKVTEDIAEQIATAKVEEPKKEKPKKKR